MEPAAATDGGSVVGIDDLIAALDSGRTILGGSELHAVMHAASQAALRVTGELNGGYHEPAVVRALLARLTGRDVDESVVLFPPFSADFGRNIRLGKRVFINAGCAFQDQGGITIEDDALIGHNVIIATLNHGLAPTRRADLHPAPVLIGRGAWIGSRSTILPGVTIGPGAVVAAASVVTRDVRANSVVMGTPARIVRSDVDSVAAPDGQRPPTDGGMS